VLSASDKFVPDKQIGRAPIGSSLAAFRSRYPKEVWHEGVYDKRTGGRLYGVWLDPRAQEGDPHGLEITVRTDRSGHIWMQSAFTHDLDDRSSWLHGASGVGIGSTLPELRGRYHDLHCGVPTSNACIYGHGARNRLTVFAFDREIRTTSGAHTRQTPARVWALTIECVGGRASTLCAGGSQRAHRS
jgi:hypothetical protein